MKTKLSALLIAILFLFFGINSVILAQNKDPKAKAPVKTEKQVNKKNSETMTKTNDNETTKTETSNNSTVKEKKTDKTIAKKPGDMMTHNSEMTHNKEMVHHKMMKDKSKLKEKEKTTKEN